MGETAIDEDTFAEYLEGMRVHYTADKVRRVSRSLRVLTSRSTTCSVSPCRVTRTRLTAHRFQLQHVHQRLYWVSHGGKYTIVHYM